MLQRSEFWPPYLCILFFIYYLLQGNPILGVHVYLYSDDVSEVRCTQGVGNAPREKSALCHAISDANGKFAFRSLPCGNHLY